MSETPTTPTNPYLRMFATVYLVGMGAGAILNSAGEVPFWYELFTGSLVTVSTVAYVFVALSMILLYMDNQLELIRTSLPLSVPAVLLALANVALMLSNKFVISAAIVSACILASYFVRLVLMPTPTGENSG